MCLIVAHISSFRFIVAHNASFRFISAHQEDMFTRRNENKKNIMKFTFGFAHFGSFLLTGGHGWQ